MVEPTPRIALIHALEESVYPARNAFAHMWPEAFCFDLLDTSLAIDLADLGHLDQPMMQRFQTLADYATATTGKAGQTQAILFTCSAFGPAIDAVKEKLPIPVLRPNEAAFEDALAIGSNIGLLVTFGPSSAALEEELHAMAKQRGKDIRVTTIVADSALAALKAGDGDRHDQLAVEASRALEHLDVLVLGQFSLARAADPIRGVISAPVLTTPGSAVAALKARLAPPSF
ncbi:aspartate/glutamate racemase family protein [Rhizobium oryziradicis]|uniref:Arylsulfatase n=1 Tax=Rhizobium oryziradicis TaxID=1867956 RepID=A0A1Q8ZWE1_9HYPH|nr:aspartate/glutamate racemase family protein [Rhizobium oryziradicis]OLP46376.1 hypothetical protein BJF95_04185 [Rhizobium oryziradicis]